MRRPGANGPRADYGRGLLTLARRDQRRNRNRNDARAGDDATRQRVAGGEHPANILENLDQRRWRSVERTLDHATGNAAGVDVPPIAHVDADVADAAARITEEQEIPRAQRQGIPIDGTSERRLRPGCPRNAD